MRPLGLFALVLVLAGCNCGKGVFSAFTASDENWRCAGDVNELPDLIGTGGNPTGHICCKDFDTPGVSEPFYFVAPPVYLGDVSTLYGRLLLWDLKSDIQYDLVRGRDVILQGGGSTIVLNIKTNPGRDWTSYKVRIDDDPYYEWQLEEGSVTRQATEAEIKSVLKRLTSLRLRGDFASGRDTACLDNVEFGGE